MNDVTKLDDLIDARLSRRAALLGMAGGAALAATTGIIGDANAAVEQANDSPSTLTFSEIEHGIDKKHHVAQGYTSQIVMRWGDPVEADAPPFDIKKQSPKAQATQFGYNNDFVAFYAAAARVELERSRPAMREP